MREFIESIERTGSNVGLCASRSQPKQQNLYCYIEYIPVVILFERLLFRTEMFVTLELSKIGRLSLTAFGRNSDNVQPYEIHEQPMRSNLPR